MAQKPEPDLIFFLGAGASVKAGVPDTYKLVTAFQDEVKGDSTLEPTTQKIIDLLVEWTPSLSQRREKRSRKNCGALTVARFSGQANRRRP